MGSLAADLDLAARGGRYRGPARESSVSPVAVRLRGLYLAIVTLGTRVRRHPLRQHELGPDRSPVRPGSAGSSPDSTSGSGRRRRPLVNVSDDGHWLWFDVSDSQKRYLFLLVITLVFALVAKNLLRSRTGRALQAIRDRDIAAEVMGVP